MNPCGNPPSAQFAADPRSGFRPLSVQFTDLSTGEITSWLWNFGDNSSSGQQNPTHGYLEAGTFTVSLQVSGPEGTDTEAKGNYITVSEPPTLNPPQNLTASVTDQTVNLNWDLPAQPLLLKKSNQHYYEDQARYLLARFTRKKVVSKNQAVAHSLMGNVDEVEPNNFVASAQILTGSSPVVVNGSAEVNDEGNLIIDYGGGMTDDLEDLYLLTINSTGLNITLTDANSDLDIFLLDENGMIVIDNSTIIGIADEEIDTTIAAGTYLLGVSIYDDDPAGPNVSPYVLTVTGDIANDGAGPVLQFFNIYRSQTPEARSTGTLLTNVAAQTTSYDDIIQPLLSNFNLNSSVMAQTYYYQITAVYDLGESEPSNEVSVQIDEQLARDVGAISLQIPDTVHVGESVSVSVSVQNFGTANQTNFPVSYIYNRGIPVTENYAEVLTAGATGIKTFATTWVPQAMGTYQFNAWTNLAGDENAANDSLSTPKTVIVRTEIINTPPTLAAIGNQTAIAGQVNNVALMATDEDGDPLNITIQSNPGFLSISGFTQTGNTATATLAISAGNNVSGNFAASVMVSDGRGGVDSEDFAIEVLPAAIPGNWTKINPKFGLSPLGPPMFVNEQTGWITGYGNVLYHTIDGGINWEGQTIGANTTTLKACFFIDMNSGWAVGGTNVWQVGATGSIFKTTDGGQNWITQKTNVIGILNSIYFIDSNTGWAVGGGWSESNPQGWVSTILKTTDGGSTWTSQTSPVVRNLLSAYFIDANVGWAVGDYKTVIKTTDGGQTWIAKNIGENGQYQSVFFVDAQTGWIAGSEFLKTHDGGESWTVQNLGTSGTYFWSIFFTNAQNGWVASNSPDAIHKTTDGGSSWTKVEVPDGLRSLYLVDAQIGWATGEGGLVMKTTDGGDSWSNQSYFTNSELWSAYFLDTQTGWFGGSRGVLVKTTDGGANWMVQNTSGDLGINAIYFADSKNGWACQNTGKILKTINGGDTWAQISTGTNRDFYGMFFGNANIGWAVGGAAAIEGIIYKTIDGGNSWAFQGKFANSPLMDVFFIDANTGWSVGMDGVILKTMNGGTSWTSQTSGGSSWLTDVYFHDANLGFAVGDGVILKTTDGGANWINKKMISGIAEEILFMDQQKGWAIGTGAGVAKGIGGASSGIHLLSSGRAKIWRTEDGGENWTDEFLNGSWLLSAFFNDANSGWAVGNKGNVFKYSNTLPLPAPPSELKAFALSNTEITLLWTDNASNEDGFHIYRSDGVSGDYKFLATASTDITSYTDAGLAYGTSYWYRLDAFNSSGKSAKSKDASATAGINLSVASGAIVPSKFMLEQNYPNPFNPSTVIRYSIAHASSVELRVFDLLGKEIKLLVTGRQEAGSYQVKLDSQGLTAGLYFYRLRAGEFCDTKKMIIIN